MKHWINKNYKTLIITAFLIPIITVALVSISHVTKWYGISNPITWSVYLSIGIEIAALSALAAISANMGKKVYFPFAIVTLIQFIGNIFFAYSYIDINGESFKMWVELVSPLLEFMGVEPTDFVGHKRFLSLFAGGMLPIISLSFLHMLVKFTEEDRLRELTQEESKDIVEDIKEEKIPEVAASDIVGEVSRLRLSEDDLNILEKHLSNPPEPNENLKMAVKDYMEKIKEYDIDNESGELDEEIESLIAINDVKKQPISVDLDDIEKYEIPSYPTKEEREQILTDMMQQDQELGLYDEPFDNPMIKENEVVPALSDEEVREMSMDEWERKIEIGEEEEVEELPTSPNGMDSLSTVKDQITDSVTMVNPTVEKEKIEISEVNSQITDSVTQVNQENSEVTDEEKKK